MNAHALMVLSLLMASLGCDQGSGRPPGDSDADTDADADADADADTDTDVDEPECTKHSHCDSDELCWYEECENALDRKYRFTVLDAEVGTHTPDGDTWDMGGGAPDLAVALYFDGDEPLWTSTVDDSFSPTWDQYADLVMESGGTFYVELWDIDTSSHDFAAGWYWEGNDALVWLARTEGEEFSVDDSSGTIEVWMSVEPRF